MINPTLGERRGQGGGLGGARVDKAADALYG